MVVAATPVRTATPTLLAPTSRPLRLSKVRSIWRSTRHTKRGDWLRNRARQTAQAPRKRNRPSHCKLRTWATVCDALPDIAKVAQEGLEVCVDFQEKLSVLAFAGAGDKSSRAVLPGGQQPGRLYQHADGRVRRDRKSESHNPQCPRTAEVRKIRTTMLNKSGRMLAIVIAPLCVLPWQAPTSTRRLPVPF